MKKQSASRNAQNKSSHSESMDVLFGGRLRLFQSRSGYRFSLDALLLAAFASVGARDVLADLGTGNGVIPLVLAERCGAAKIVGIEMQSSLAERARRNVALNNLSDRVSIVQGDVRAIRALAKPESFTAVLCNPPYRKASSGRLSPDEERQLARHQLHGTTADFVRAAAYLVPQKGRLFFIYDAEHSVDLLWAMQRSAVEPKRVRFVHSRSDSAASLVLVEGVKRGHAGVVVSAPLIVYSAPNEYGDEVANIIAGKK
jgi:tRNA1Val (adenine37-N6)-methyltransferase